MFTGVAGLISVCAAVSRLTGSSSWTERGQQTVDYLYSKSVTIDGRVMFPHSRSVSTHETECLTGLSHGAIGVAVALNDLREVLPIGSARTKLGRVVAGLIDWELSQFNPEVMNWPDYRVRSSCADTGEISWSHGAPGNYLALSQLASAGFDRAAEFSRTIPLLPCSSHASRPGDPSTQRGAVPRRSRHCPVCTADLGRIVLRD